MTTLSVVELVAIVTIGMVTLVAICMCGCRCGRGSTHIDVVIDNRAIEPDTDGSVFIDGDDDDPADWWKKGKPPSLGGLEEE